MMRPVRQVTATISIAVMATLLSFGAISLAHAGPRPGDDTNRYESKSTGG
jgi:hypothetical protein